ncbi:MAG: metallophosphoesterase [Anaerolineae bacterium]|jgi:Icc-related predicted phosphoesterase|nr:metallophosphoesterase [Anaerolineae bacterium]MBT4308989.1 metallophosphoesterase [Anaerolineae bacterium]MBT4459068.1 metallophosphoesterase [Anaerolineae bacterium]MBT4843563.1 metallophosphoesterase [Anaerolineae bacterium]MBT6060739.1 metallophosphoesterase [Anaerolineae bacterium]
MKILAVSDEVVNRLYTLAANHHFGDVDLLIGCGDLPYEYLEYLLTIAHLPLYYVPGNHDPEYQEFVSDSKAEGGINLDLKTARVGNLLIAGIGGSIRYRPDGVNQYTQAQIHVRILKLIPKLIYNRLRYGRALDILITHSPPFGIHDNNSQAHQGLKALNLLIRWAKPRYHLHGHTHFYRQNLESASTQVGGTIVMNIHPYKIIEVDNA